MKLIKWKSFEFSRNFNSVEDAGFEICHQIPIKICPIFKACRMALLQINLFIFKQKFTSHN
jgi:hypothetical protein